MTDLITLNEYRYLKGVGRSNTDTQIEALLTPISELVRKYCQRQFNTYVETDAEREIYTFWEEPFVVMQEIPLISISSFTLDGEEYSDYKIQKTTGQIRPLEGAWEAGKTIEVKYRAGFKKLPEDIKLALADLITYYVKEEYKELQSTQAVVLERPGTSSVRNDPSFPDHIKRVLDLYKLPEYQEN